MGERGGYILSLCDRTGTMVEPWLAAGVPCVTVDLKEAAYSHPFRRHLREDVRTLVLPGGYPIAVFAFPPCTHLASSGARWWKGKGMGLLIEALQAVEACRRLCEDSGAPYMIENPVGSLSKYWREPDYSFHPVHYAGYSPDPKADGYSKKTCLWTGGGFVMPDRKPGEPSLGALIHRMPPSEDRADKRSATPAGFAHAVFEANRRTVLKAYAQSVSVTA